MMVALNILKILLGVMFVNTYLIEPPMEEYQLKSIKN